MNTTTNPAVLRELLNPDTPLDQIAERHDLPIPDLLAILESDDFHAAADALARAESIRAAALAPVRRERALRSLTALAGQEPTSATHAESVRRAATAILKETRPDPDTPAQPARPAHPGADRPSRAHAPNAAPGTPLAPAQLLQALASPDLTAQLDTMLAALERAESSRPPATPGQAPPPEPAPAAHAA